MTIGGEADLTTQTLLTIGPSMFFYSYFAGFGRDDLAAAFASADPFALPPAEIVERVIALGCTPTTELRKSEMWPTRGRVYEVERNGQAFLVAVSWDAQEISVQEVREDAAEPVE